MNTVACVGKFFFSFYNWYNVNVILFREIIVSLVVRGAAKNCASSIIH